MMDMVKRVLHRNEGNGWDVQKFHEMFHLIHDMTRFGAPMNFDSGTGWYHLLHIHVIFVSVYMSQIISMLLYLLYTGEKFHKFNAKMPAATAQLQSQAKFQAQSLTV